MREVEKHAKIKQNEVIIIIKIYFSYLRNILCIQLKIDFKIFFSYLIIFFLK